jgi:hypothetical protein
MSGISFAAFDCSSLFLKDNNQKKSIPEKQGQIIYI